MNDNLENIKRQKVMAVRIIENVLFLPRRHSLFLAIGKLEPLSYFMNYPAGLNT